MEKSSSTKPILVPKRLGTATSGSYPSAWGANLLALWMSENFFILASLELRYLGIEISAKSFLRSWFCLSAGFQFAIEELGAIDSWSFVWSLFFILSELLHPYVIFISRVLKFHFGVGLFLSVVLGACWDMSFYKFTIFNLGDFSFSLLFLWFSFAFSVLSFGTLVKSLVLMACFVLLSFGFIFF